MEVHQQTFASSSLFATTSDFATSRSELAATAVDSLVSSPCSRTNPVETRQFVTMDCVGRMNAEEDFIYASTLKLDSEICGGCELSIIDRTFLTANGRSWHEECLRCLACGILLHSQPSCFCKEGNVFCKACYNRQYGTKCAACDRVIQPTDWVRRARSCVFHLACFACDQCKRQLSTGEEFALQESRLLCKQHFVELVEGDSGVGQQKQKTKRVRTTFAEEQLSVLQSHFQHDSNPDGADLERIATITGLSKRVTQVWFQNSRARQKKYQGGRKGEGTDSQRSSEDPTSPGQKSENSSDGLMYPTSVTTSAEDAMSESTAALSSLQYD